VEKRPGRHIRRIQGGPHSGAGPIVQESDPSLTRGCHPHVQALSIPRVTHPRLCVKAHADPSVRVEPEAELLRTFGAQDFHSEVLSTIRHRCAKHDALATLGVLENESPRSQYV